MRNRIHDENACAAEVTVKLSELFVIPLAAFDHVKHLGSVFERAWPFSWMREVSRGNHRELTSGRFDDRLSKCRPAGKFCLSTIGNPPCAGPGLDSPTEHVIIVGQLLPSSALRHCHMS